MQSRLKMVLCMVIAGTLLIPITGWPTNGYFLIGYGAKSRSMGGVGTAYATDALAAASNPATMGQVDASIMRVDAGVELFLPKRTATNYSDTLGTVKNEKSGSNEFLIPSMGIIYKVNRKLTLGFAAIGNGANTRYKQQVPGLPNCVNGNTEDGIGSYFFNFNCNADSTTLGVNLLQMQLLPSASYQISNQHSIGASIAIAAQQFRAYGLGAFQDLGFASSTKNVSGEGNDYSYGAGVRLGWLSRFFNERLSVGANYASRVHMTKFNKYKSLFAEQGSFDIPAHFSLGLAYAFTPKLTVAADVQRIFYSDIASINNWGPSVKDPDDFNINGSCKNKPDDEEPDNCLMGGDDGFGFGWGDQTVYKIGFNYDYNKNWSFRAGFNYAKYPMKNNEVVGDQVLLNLIAPAVSKKHYTVGASYRPDANIEWSVNYMYAPAEDLTGPTSFSNREPYKNSAAASMRINSFGVSFAYKM